MIQKVQLENLKKEFVVLYYKYEGYLIRRSEIINGRKKVLVLPDGTVLDLDQMFIEETDRHGNSLRFHRLVGKNPEYRISGKLPIIDVVQISTPETELYREGVLWS